MNEYSFTPTPRLHWLGILLSGALALTACGKGAETNTPPASSSSATPASAPASAASGTTLAGAVVGTWRQICQPYIPGDGASDITYTITQQGANGLKLEGVAKDYKSTSCSGNGKVIATPVFVQKMVGNTTVAGIPVLKLMDEGAPANAPADSKSIVGIDKGQLRFGSAKGPRDGDGFPTQFEKPGDSYNKL